MAKSYKLRVAIVEDDASAAGELEIAITRIASTRIASNEEQVFFQLASFQPHAVLLDITLEGETKYPPRTAGIRILERIRQQLSPAADVPVIVVTGRVGSEIETECRGFGVSDYFRKPVKNSTLRKAIQAAVERSRQRPASSDPAPKRVFISYSPKDEGVCDLLMTHLRPLERQGLVSPWRHVDTPAGTDWRQRLYDELHAAQVAVLLVSAHYLASEFVNDHELPYLLEAADRDEIKILWTSASHVETTPPRLARYQAARSPNVPLNTLSGPELDKELAKLVQEILKAPDVSERPGAG